MILEISSDAESDLCDGYWFYERQSPGLGDYFRSCLISDIDSLQFFAGIHSIENGYHRLLSKRFPHAVFYSMTHDRVVIVAVLDLRREPLFIQRRLGGSSPRSS